MSPNRRTPKLKARGLLARAAVWAVLVVVFAVLAFAIVLRPALLGVVAAGAVIGLVLRFAIERRRVAVAARALAEVAQADDLLLRERARPRQGLRLLVAVGALALALASFVFAAFLTQGTQLDVAPISAPPPPDAHRVPYRAVLDFQEKGDWVGQEWFTLKLSEAEALVPAGNGSLRARLRAAVPRGWNVRSDTTGDATVYRIQRNYPSHPFDVPAWRPLTISHSLPAPYLRSPQFRYTLFAADGSTVTLHARENRVFATAPSSSASPEAGARVKRTVKLEVIGVQEAGSGVDIEVESDLATHLKQEWVGHGMWVLISGIRGAGAHIHRCDRNAEDRSQVAIPQANRRRRTRAYEERLARQAE